MQTTGWVSNDAAIFFLWMIVVVVFAIRQSMKEDKDGRRR